jgi:O-antigen/teichoic acid export membrane protein
MLKRNIIANYLGRFYSILIGIVVLPVYLDYLGAEAYGLIGFFTMLIAWLMLLDMGFSQVLSREAAKLKETVDGRLELKIILRSVESMIFIFSIFIFIAVFMTSSYVANSWLDIKELSIQNVIDSINLIGFIFIFKWYGSLYNSLVLGFEQQVWLNVYKIFMATLRFVGGLLLIMYITTDIYYYFLYQVLVSIIEVVLLQYKVYINLPKSKTLTYPTYDALKKVAPFALGLAYTSGVWIIYTQLDKLLLSHYIPLNEYGYFTLVVLISTAIMQLSAPLSYAVLPRMTALLSTNKEEEMLMLYRMGTKFIAIVIFSIVGMVCLFSYELLYAWTGDIVASSWASPILFWYALGNGVLVLSAFPYYLQFAHGDIRYHIQFNTYFPLVALPIVLYAVINYGAIGAGISWFIIQLFIFLFWPAFIHSKFAIGLHKTWITRDILPTLFVTITYLSLLYLLDIDFTDYSRIMIFMILILLGVFLLILNMLAFAQIRSKINHFIKGLFS